ncbi:MAG: flavin reductase family protein [Paracoccaceae bacterium]
MRHQADVSNSFAGRTEAKGVDKFNAASWTTAETGAPLLDGVLASFDCKVMHDVLVGTHRVFVGEALAVASQAEGLPLLYFARDYAEPGTLSA